MTHIFEISDPDLRIQNTNYMGLRRRLRALLMLPLVIFGGKLLSPFWGPKSTFGGKIKGLNIILDFSNP